MERRPTEPIDVVVSEFAKRVRRVMGSTVEHIYWFGSRARGNHGRASDYDLLVETSAPIGRSDRARITEVTVDVSGTYRVLLDVHYASTARMNPRASSLSPFRDGVLKEGIRV